MNYATRISIVLVCVGLAACASRQGSPLAKEPTLRVADAALAGGAPGVALNVAHSILAKHPRDVDALVHQGDALFAMDRLDAAANSYRTALQLHPGNIAARLGLARTRLRIDPAGAEAMFLQILSADPSNAAAMNDLGIARDLQGRHAAAQEVYARAAAIAPEMTAAQVNLGLSLALSGNGGRALEILRPLASASGATPRIRQDLAVAMVMAGEEQNARGVLRADLSEAQAADALSAYEQLRAPRPPTRN